MSSPFLIGERVQLRPLEDDDAALLRQWLNDPDIRQYLPMRRFPLTLQEEKEWLASVRAGQGTPRNMALGIELKKGARLIGTVGLHAIDWIHRRGMTGSFIGPRALRGRGLGTEAKNLMLDHAFADLGMESIWSFVVEDNVASIRALRKQGYQQNGVFRHSALVDGQWKDCLYFDLLRAEWELRRGRTSGATRTRRTPAATGTGRTSAVAGTRRTSGTTGTRPTRRAGH